MKKEQNNGRMIGLLLLAIISLLISSCAAPKPIGRQVIRDDGGKVSGNITLSSQHIAKIREAFIGRSFAFKKDWYEYEFIDSDPVGGFGEPEPVTKLPSTIANRGYRKKIASTGVVAKIVGTKTSYNMFTFICETADGNRAYLRILNYRPWTLFFGKRSSGNRVQRDSLDDEQITISWLERNLSYSAIEFIEDLPEEISKTSITPPNKAALSAKTTGNHYQTGKAYEDNKQYEMAFSSYRKSAESGNPAGQNSLGNMYYYGRGVSKDSLKAVKWYYKAAKKGYMQAQLNLGYMFENGTGVRKSTEEAIKWYTKAADQGSQKAKNSLLRLQATP